MTRKVLVLVGMHRSGTSLASSWLQRCGLYVGERVSPSLYEDQDFLELHQEILRRNRKSHLLSESVQLEIDDDLRKRAKYLINTRKQFHAWGWKDPRTALFLPFWQEILTDGHFLMIYRHCAHVVDSLHRRNKPRRLAEPAYYVRGECFAQSRVSLRDRLVTPYGYLVDRHPRVANIIRQVVVNPLRRARSSFWNLPLTRLYAQNWSCYNQRILAFWQANQNRCMCVSIDVLLEKSEQMIEAINSTWQFDLLPIPISTVFSTERMKRRHSHWHSWLCEFVYRPVKSVGKELAMAQEDTLRRLQPPEIT